MKSNSLQTLIASLYFKLITPADEDSQPIELLPEPRCFGPKVIMTYLKTFHPDFRYIGMGRTFIHGVAFIECIQESTGRTNYIYVGDKGIAVYECDGDESPEFEFDAWIEGPDEDDIPIVPAEELFVPNVEKEVDTLIDPLAAMDEKKFMKRLKVWLNNEWTEKYNYAFDNKTKNPMSMSDQDILEAVVGMVIMGKEDESYGDSPGVIMPKDINLDLTTIIPAIRYTLSSGIIEYIYLDEGKTPTRYTPYRGNWRVNPKNHYAGTYYPIWIAAGVMTPTERSQKVSDQVGFERVKVNWFEGDIPMAVYDAVASEWAEVCGTSTTVKAVSHTIDPGSLSQQGLSRLDNLLYELEFYKDITVVKGLIESIQKEINSRGLGVGTYWKHPTEEIYIRVLRNTKTKVEYEVLQNNTLTGTGFYVSPGAFDNFLIDPKTGDVSVDGVVWDKSNEGVWRKKKMIVKNETII